jgi:hypothetical protein
MTLGEHVFLYCERGTDPALLAEPINALSNLAILFAALVALQLVLWRPREEQSADHFLLCGLVFFIGLGSLSFHLFANQGTALLDVIPIGVFMLVYLGFALNRFLGVPPGWTVLLVIGFTAIAAIALQVQCVDGAIGLAGGKDAKPCLNGSVGYLPALAAMIVVGLLLSERHHRAAPYVLTAAAIFTVSVTLRSLDVALCDKVIIEGRKVGTHFAWHILNAIALFLLLRASLEGRPEQEAGAEAAPPEEEEPISQERLAEIVAPFPRAKPPVHVAPTIVEAVVDEIPEEESEQREAGHSEKELEPEREASEALKEDPEGSGRMDSEADALAENPEAPNARPKEPSDEAAQKKRKRRSFLDLVRS